MPAPGQQPEGVHDVWATLTLFRFPAGLTSLDRAEADGLAAHTPSRQQGVHIDRSLPHAGLVFIAHTSSSTYIVLDSSPSDNEVAKTKQVDVWSSPLTAIMARGNASPRTAQWASWTCSCSTSGLRAWMTWLRMSSFLDLLWHFWHMRTDPASQCHK